MPIRLSAAPEPLSGMSYLEPVAQIESDASRLLAQEMLSYCQGRINGRSFLIAGHRGSGKTTMVGGAYLKTRKRSEVDRRTMRPLLVQLNGTTLLPSVRGDEAHGQSEEPSASRPWYESAGDAGAVAQLEAQEALVQITLCLFRALSKEVAREFRRKAVVHPVNGRALSRSQLRDRLELAAQLEIELYECPDPARLRFFWERAGLLGATPLSLFQAPFWRKRTGSELDEAGQGLRELVAISGTADAFRRISGTLKQQQTTTQNAEDKQESTLGIDTSGKSVLDALTALLSGALVGTGVLAGQKGAIPSAIAGIATALAAAGVLRIQHARSRTRAKHTENSFLFDTSVTTLDRALPILIERLHEAGVAPIFVVDELDKVERLNHRMGGLVRYLKMLVADQAFFCFLTDRTYYEAIRQHGKGLPYPVEYTYFTHQLYVIFTAPDLHDYLERIPQPSPPASGAGASPTASPVLSAPAQAAMQSQNEADWAVLSFILLHKAKMHSLDLHRELIQICNEAGDVLSKSGEARTLRSAGHEALLQVAVEISLDSPRIVHRVERSPDFLRVVHDALYYPSRCWESQSPLDLSDPALPQFERYLRERMGWGADKNEAVPPCGPADLDLLFEEVRALAASVAGPRDSFLASFDGWLEARPDRASAGSDGDGAEQQTRVSRRARLDQVARDTLSAAYSDRLLEREGDTWIFRWLFDASGNSVPAAATAARGRSDRIRAAGTGRRGSRQSGRALAAEPAAPKPAPDWKIHEQLVVAVASLLAELNAAPAAPGGAGGPAVAGPVDFNFLTTETGILMTSPAWPVVQRALADLAVAEREARPVEETDASCVRDFATMLIENGESLARALAWGARIGWAAPQGTAGMRLLLGLRILANALRFADLRPAQVRDALRQLDVSARDASWPDLMLDQAQAPPHLDTGPQGEAWIGWVRERAMELVADPRKLPPISADQLKTVRQQSWTSWIARLNAYFEGAIVPPAVPDLLCAAAGIGPAALLEFRLETMTVAAWTAVLLAAVVPAPKDDPEAIKLTPFALRALGFEPAASWDKLVSQFPRLAGIKPPFPSDFAVIASTSGEPSVRALFLRQSPASLIDSLLPSPSCAALSLTLEQLRNRHLQPAAVRLAGALLLAWIVAEEPVDRHAALPFAVDYSWIVPLGPKLSTQPSGNYITAPTSLDRIADYLHSLYTWPGQARS